MAEFAEVMRQSRRMCKAHAGCEGCAVRWIENPGRRICCDLAFENPAMFEERVMKWAAEHPEPAYPTWAEWQKKTFPDHHAPVNPCIFASCKALECDGDCRGCANKPISADVAAKLGVKPIENKGGTGK